MKTAFLKIHEKQRALLSIYTTPDTWRTTNLQQNVHVAPLDCGEPQVLAAANPVFLTEIRNQKGEPYRAETIKNIFASLNRYLDDNGFHMILNL